MIRRPKPSDDEEELLRMQEEYLLEKSKDPHYKPAAQVTRLCEESVESPRNTDTTKGRSKYAQSRGLTGSTEKRHTTEASVSSVFGDVIEKSAEDSKCALEDDKVYFPRVLPSILGNIVEKNVEMESDLVMPQMPSQGFPEVTKRTLSMVTQRESSPNQHANAKDECKMDIDMYDSEASCESLPTPVNMPSQSFIITSKEADDIHNENLKLLSSMSPKEILEEQQKLIGNLDPKLVEFIKAKRQRTASKNVPENHTIKRKRNEDMDTSVTFEESVSSKTATVVVEDSNKAGQLTEAMDDSLWENDVLSNPQVNKWLHFNSLEKDKLEWMKGIQESKNVNPDEPYEARFDFKGYLLPYTVEYTEDTKTLFHHGEEPHRPGYTLNELFELSRSSVTQQRVMALNTIAGILEYNSVGMYKNIIDLPLSKIFFIIRIAMDENKVMLLEPALKAMRNLFYNRIDEASLDTLVGFAEGNIQLYLENDKSEIEELESKESELKDFHLAEIDLVAAILRTDIMQRLFYILDTIKPTFNCVQYALQILTRLVRDSNDTALKIVQSENLMKTIITNFLPTTLGNFVFDPQMVYRRMPVLSAVRLFRILSLQSEEIATILADKYKILEPISGYINLGVERSYESRVQIEAYCLLTNLLHHKVGIDTAKALLPVITTTLDRHVQETDLGLQSTMTSVSHAAIVVQLVNKFLWLNLQDIRPYKGQLFTLLNEGMQKWIKQIFQAESYNLQQLRLLCAALDCSQTVQLLRNYPVQIFINYMKHLSSSPGFCVFLKNLVPTSNILSRLDNSKLHFTKNLMTLGTSVIDSKHKVLPILTTASPFPFMASLFKILAGMNDRILAEAYLQHLTPYLKKLSKRSPALTDNWFTRNEIEFLYNVLKLALQIEVYESQKDLLYVVANKLCYIFRTDRKVELQFLFDKIIFNKHWFTVERLMRMVKVCYPDGLGEAMVSIEELKECYSKSMNLNDRETGSIVTLLQWKEPLLPRDWIYLPILLLYSKRHELEETPVVHGDHAKKVADLAIAEKKSIIACSLQWILFNEISFPDLLQDIDVTDRFCRIMCVFLCDNSIFLDTKVKVILRNCVQILFKKKDSFNFDKELVGLHNFQDFYTEFLEQFQSVSYGDPTFSACVLVPLAQRHNIKWRKLIWSEYAGCLRALDCPEELLCYDLKEYLQPEETDESLIKSYCRALSSNLLRPNTVAYKIAKHHVDSFKLRTK